MNFNNLVFEWNGQVTKRQKSINFLGPFLFLLVSSSFLNLCTCDVEPKPHYEDPTTVLTKFNTGMDDINSISNSDGHFINESLKSSSAITDLGFLHAFIASISVILVSELGDKTFFIAAIMAMRHPRLTVFIGAMSALALMTILSAVFGMAATIIPRVYTYYISTALFAIFGLKMLKEGYYMSPTDAQEELEEVQSDLRKREDELLKTLRESEILEQNSRDGSPKSLRSRLGSDVYNDDVDDPNCTGNQVQSVIKASDINSDEGPSSNSTPARDINRYSLELIPSATALDHATTIVHKGVHTKPNCGINTNGIELVQLGGCKNRLEKEVSLTLIQDPENGVVRKSKQRSAAYLASRIFMQAFTMTFLAEWGDRSQLTTIILSAREDVYGVIVGGVLGHSMCTGLAVIGGRMIAQKISVRTVTLVGGVVFLIFAISALFFNPNDE